MPPLLPRSFPFDNKRPESETDTPLPTSHWRNIGAKLIAFVGSKSHLSRLSNNENPRQIENVLPCVLQKYPLRGYSPMEDRMRYLGTTDFRIVYVQGCPININPRVHSAVIVDTIVSDQSDSGACTTHSKSRRKQGKLFRNSASKHTHLRRVFSDKLHAIAIVNTLRNRFRRGWWERRANFCSRLQQNEGQRTWLRDC